MISLVHIYCSSKLQPYVFEKKKLQPYIFSSMWMNNILHILPFVYNKKYIMMSCLIRSYYRCANSKDQGCLATKTVQQKESDGSAGTVRLFDVDYYGQHICKKDDIIHPYVVETTKYSAPIVNHNQSISGSTVVHNDVLGIQDESFENLFMVPSTPEYLIDFTDVEMAGALEVTSMMIPEDIWA